MAHTVLVAMPTFTITEEEVDLDEMCCDSEVGPESIIAVAVTTPESGEWAREMEVTITVREHPATPLRFYVTERPDSWGTSVTLLKLDGFTEQTVIERGTEGNPDLTVAHLFPVAEAIADLTFGGC
jgi:hypothetical protein